MEGVRLTYKNVPKFTFESYRGEFNIKLQKKILIEKALRRYGGKTVLAAKENGVEHRTYLNMLHQHNINIEEFKI